MKRRSEILKGIKVLITTAVLFAACFGTMWGTTFRWEDDTVSANWSDYKKWQYQNLLGRWEQPGGDYPGEKNETADVQIRGTNHNNVTVTLDNDTKDPLTLNSLTISEAENSSDGIITIDTNNHDLIIKNNLNLLASGGVANHDVTLRITGGGTIETAYFDIPENLNGHTFEVYVAAGTTLKINNTAYINLNENTSGSFLFTGPGTILYNNLDTTNNNDVFFDEETNIGSEIKAGDQSYAVTVKPQFELGVTSTVSINSDKNFDNIYLDIQLAGSSTGYKINGATYSDKAENVQISTSGTKEFSFDISIPSTISSGDGFDLKIKDSANTIVLKNFSFRSTGNSPTSTWNGTSWDIEPNSSYTKYLIFAGDYKVQATDDFSKLTKLQKITVNNGVILESFSETDFNNVKLVLDGTVKLCGDEKNINSETATTGSEFKIEYIPGATTANNVWNKNYNKLTVNSGVTLYSDSDITIDGELILDGTIHANGNFKINNTIRGNSSGKLYCSKNFEQTDGTANDNQILFDGTEDQFVKFLPANTYNVKIAKTGGNITFENDSKFSEITTDDKNYTVIIGSGCSSFGKTNGAGVTIKGNLINNNTTGVTLTSDLIISRNFTDNGIINSGTKGKITLNGTTDQTFKGSASTTYLGITVNRDSNTAVIFAGTINSTQIKLEKNKESADGTITFNGAVTTDDLYIQNEIHNITFENSLTATATRLANTCEITLNGSSSLGALTATAGAATIDGDFIVGSVTINDGASIIAGTDANITVTGNWTDNTTAAAGGFTANGNTVTFGASTISGTTNFAKVILTDDTTLSGNLVFDDLTATGLNGKTLTFNSGAMEVKTMTLSGNSSGHLNIKGDGSATIQIPGNLESGDYLAVYSNAPVITGGKFTVGNSNEPNGPGTAPSGWDIRAGNIPFRWIGGTTAHKNDWGTGSNWNKGIVPSSSDEVTIPAGLTDTDYPDFDASGTTITAEVTIDALTVETGATLKAGATNSLTITSSATVAGTLGGKITSTNGFNVTGNLTLDSANINGDINASGYGITISNYAVVSIAGNLTAKSFGYIYATSIINGDIDIEDGISFRGGKLNHQSGEITSRSFINIYDSSLTTEFSGTSTADQKYDIRYTNVSKASKISGNSITFSNFTNTTAPNCPITFDCPVVFTKDNLNGTTNTIKGVTLGENCTKFERSDNGEITIDGTLSVDSSETELTINTDLNIKGSLMASGRKLISPELRKITLSGTDTQVFLLNSSSTFNEIEINRPGATDGVSIMNDLNATKVTMIENNGQTTNFSKVNIGSFETTANSGNLQFSEGSITALENNEWNQSGTLSVNNTPADESKSLTIGGAVTLKPTAALKLDGNTKLIFSGAVTNSVDGTGLTINNEVSAEGTFSNNKALTINADKSLTIKGKLTNSNDITVNGTLNLLGDFDDSSSTDTSFGTSGVINFTGANDQTWNPKSSVSYKIGMDKTAGTVTIPDAVNFASFTDTNTNKGGITFRDSADFSSITAGMAINTEGTITFESTASLTAAKISVPNGKVSTAINLEVSGPIVSDSTISLNKVEISGADVEITAWDIRITDSVLPKNNDTASLTLTATSNDTTGNVAIAVGSGGDSKITIGESTKQFTNISLSAPNQYIKFDGTVINVFATSTVTAKAKRVEFLSYTTTNSLVINADELVAINGLEAESLSVKDLDGTSTYTGTSQYGQTIKLTGAADFEIDYTASLIGGTSFELTDSSSKFILNSGKIKSVTGSGLTATDVDDDSKGHTLTISAAGGIELSGTFDGYTSLELKNSASVNGANTFPKLIIDTSAIDAATTITFESGKTQTAKSEFSAKGKASSKEVTLKPSSTGDWKLAFDGTITENTAFAFAILDKCNSTNELNLYPKAAYVTDSNPSAFTCTNCFTHKYYWKGGKIDAESTWTESENWTFDEAGSITLDSGHYPRYDNSSSKIVIGGTNAAKLPEDVSLKTVTVNSDATLDLQGHRLTISDSFENNGTVKLNGTQLEASPATVILPAGSVENGTWSFSGGIIKPITNLTYNYVEATDDLKITNIEANNFVINGASTITGEANTTITAPVTVSSAAAFAMGTNTLEINGAVTLDADLEITADSIKFDSTIDGGNNLTVNGAADFEDIVGGATAVTNLTVTGAGSFEKTVTTAGNISVNGAADFDGSVTTTNGGNIVLGSTADFADTVTSSGYITVVSAAAFSLASGTQTVTATTITLEGNVKSATSYELIATTINLCKADKVDTTTIKSNNGNQTYKGTVNILSKAKLEAENLSVSTVNFNADVDFAGEVNLESGTSISVATTSTTAKAKFSKGFAANANVDLTGNAEIYGDNQFSSINIDNSTLDDQTTVSFEGNKTQKIGTFTSKGKSQDKYVLLQSTDSNDWKVYFVNKPFDASAESPNVPSFSYTRVKNSHSVNSTGADAELSYMQTLNTISEEDSSVKTCKCWFTYKAYWLGGTSTLWSDPANWAYTADGSKKYISSPDYSNSLSEIIIYDNNPNILSIPASSITELKLKSIEVSAGKTADFGTAKITAETFINNGHIRLAGNNGAAIPAAQIISAATITNGDDSTVEYYDTIAGSLPWGQTYQNIEFTENAAGTIYSGLTVNGTTKITNDSTKELKLTGSNIFKDSIHIGKVSGGIETPAGFIELKGTGASGSALNIATDVYANSLLLYSPVKFSGNVKTAGAQTYYGNITANNIKFTATTVILGDGGSGSVISVTSTNKTQEYDAAVTLAADTTITATSVVFDGAVSGAKDLSINAGSLTFKSTVDEIKDLTVNGNMEVKDKVGSSKALSEITVSGNWTNSATVGNNSVNTTGSVIFTGADKELSGNNSFSNVEFLNSIYIKDDNTFGTLTAGTSALPLNGKTLTFQAGKTQTITGKFSAKGTVPSNLLKLVSSTPGTQWNINTADYDIEFVDVKDSNNTSTNRLTATGPSKDSGNNDRWNFTGIPYVWTGASDTNWFNKDNWNIKSVPGIGAIVTIPTVASNNYPELETSLLDDESANASVGATGTITVDSQFDLSSYTLTAGTITNNGLLRLKGTSSQITADMVNGTDSIVEYYGGLTTNLCWDGDKSLAGNQYENLNITGATNSTATTPVITVAKALTITAAASIAAPVQVTGLTTINTTQNVTLDNSSNNFTGNVKLTNSGETTLRAESTFTIDNNAAAASLTVNSPVRIQNVTTANNMTFNSTLELSDSATLSSSSGTITFADSVSGGTYTLTLDGDSTISAALSVSAGEIINNAAKTLTIPESKALSINGKLSNNGIIKANADLNVNGDFDNNSGASITGSAVNISGNLKDDGVWASMINFNGSEAQTFTANTGTTYSAVTNSNSHADGVTLNSNLVADSIVNKGTLVVGANTLKTKAFTIDPAIQNSVSVTEGTLTVEGNTSAVTIPNVKITTSANLNGDSTFGLKITNATYNDSDISTTGIVELGEGSMGALSVSAGTTTVAGNVTAAAVSITNGAVFVISDSKELTVKGNWTNNNLTGGFTANSSKVIFDTTGSHTISGSQTFNNVEINESAVITGSNNYTNFTATGSSDLGGKTLTFQAGKTQTITGKFSAKGTDPSNLLKLVSSTPGTQWIIDTADYEIEFVDVKDSNNTSTNRLTATGPSKDSGNNDRWNFIGHDYTWLGGASGNTTQWFEKTNWSPASIPGTGTKVSIPAGKTYYPVLTADISSGTSAPAELTIASGAEIDLAGRKLTVTSAFTNNGTVKLNGTQLSASPATVILPAGSVENGTWIFNSDGSGNGIIRPVANLSNETKNFRNVIVTDSMNIESISAESFTVNSASALCTLAGTSDVTISTPVTVSSATAFAMGTNKLEVTGAVTLDADLEITADSAKFDSTVDGGNNLTVNGAADFADIVGGSTAVADLTVTGAGSFKKAVTAAGDLHVTGAATFGANVTAANILLEDTAGFTLASGTQTVTSAAGTQTYYGNITSNNIKFTADSVTLGDGSAASSISVTSEEKSQEYDAAVILAADTTITASFVVFDRTVNGARDLSITADTADFKDIVGGTTAVADLTLTGPGSFEKAVSTAGNISVNGAATFGGSVTATNGGNITVNGRTDINTNSIKSDGNQTYNDAVTLYKDTVLTAATNKVIFKSTVDSAASSNHSLTIGDVDNATNVQFDGNAGALTNAALSTVFVYGTSQINSEEITTTDNQTYIGAVTIGSKDTTFTSVSGKLIKFANTLSGTESITFSDTDVEFDGVVSGFKNLTANGKTKFVTTSISTTQAQSYNGEVTLEVPSATPMNPVSFTAGDASNINFTKNITGESQILQIAGGIAVLSDSITVEPAVINSANISINNAVIFKNSVTNNATLSCKDDADNTVTFNSTYTGTAAIFYAGKGTVIFNSDVDLSDTNFNAQSGTVRLSPSSEPTTLKGQSDGSTTFHDFEVTGSVNLASSLKYTNFNATGTSGLGGKSITFQAGETQIIIGKFNAKGTDPSNLLKLVSSTPGTQWFINTADHEIQFVDVQDSNNISTSRLTASGPSTDSGNNDRWNFTGIPYTWTGASDTDWFNKANWNINSVPGIGAVVTIPEVTSPAFYPVLENDLENSDTAHASVGAGGSITVNSNAIFDMADKSVSAQTITNNGRIRLTGNQTIKADDTIPTAIENTSTSTVEYYGDCSTNQMKGTVGESNFQNLEFTDGANGTISDIKVAGSTLIANGTNSLSLSGENIFTGKVTLGNESVSAGTIIINTVEDITISPAAKADTVTLTASSKTVTLEGSFSSTGATNITANLSTIGGTSDSDKVELSAGDTGLTITGNWTNDGFITNKAATKITGNFVNNADKLYESASASISEIDGNLENKGTITFNNGVSITQNFKDTGTWNSNDSIGHIIFNGNTDQTISLNPETTYNTITVEKESNITFDKETKITNLFVNKAKASIFQSPVTIGKLEDTANAGSFTFVSYGNILHDTEFLTTNSVTFGSTAQNLFTFGEKGSSTFYNVTHTAADTNIFGNLKAKDIKFALTNCKTNLQIDCNSFNLEGNVDADTDVSYLKVQGDLITRGNITIAPNLMLDGSFTSQDTTTIEANFYLFTTQENPSPISVNSVTVTGDLIISAPRRTIRTSETITAENIVLYQGDLFAANYSILHANKDIVLLGSEYNIENTITNNSIEYIYQNSHRLSVFNYLRPDFTKVTEGQKMDYFPDGTALPTGSNDSNSFEGSYTAGKESSIYAGKNFYANGLSLCGESKWFVDIPDLTNAKNGFGEGHRLLIENSTVRCHVDESSDGAKAKIPAYDCNDNGNNHNWIFDNYEFAGIYTVRDNCIKIEFNRPLRNSNGELIASLSRFSNSDSAYIGFYMDEDCTKPLENENVMDGIVYLKAKNTWNTDATGSSEGSDSATDREGNHKAITPWVEVSKIAHGELNSISDIWGKKLANYSGENRYTETIDSTGPVLYSVRTGQELHTIPDGTAESQHSYDAHNFIEFRYSEPVNFGDKEDPKIGLWIPAYDELGDVNIQENIAVTEHFGALVNNITSEGKLNFAGLGEIENGLLYTGKNGTPDKYVNALYRKDAYSLCISIAGLTDGTVFDPDGNIFKNWIGYIEKAKMPSGEVKMNFEKINPLVTDIDGNPQENYTDSTQNKIPVVNSTEKKLYGAWDLSEPIFAPLRMATRNTDGLNNWNEKLLISGKQVEAIGNTPGTGSTLDRIEFHLLDNTPTFALSEPEWVSEIGWITPNGEAVKESLYTDYSYSADKFGGARKFDSDENRRTAGGIRYSTICNEAKAFKYINITGSNYQEPTNNFANSKAYGGANGLIFTGTATPRRSALELDGLYFAMPLGITKYDIKTNFAISYDATNSYITDLAGNRLRSTHFTTIDRTPPTFDITLSPVNDNEIYISFVKELVTKSKDILYIDNEGNKIDVSISGTFEEILPYCFEFISIDETGFAHPSTLKVDTSIPAVIMPKSNDKFTCIKLTLERNITIEDVKNLYVSITNHPDYEFKSMDPLSNNKDSRVSFIQDANRNYMEIYSAHALSDFAINTINPLYAYDEDMAESAENTSLFDGLYNEGSWAVHDWNENQSNYGTLPADHNLAIVAENNGGEKDMAPLSARIYLSNMPDTNSVSSQYNDDFSDNLRIWLPNETDKVFTALSGVNNTNYKTIESNLLDEDDPSAGLIFHLPASLVETWATGNQITFLFALTDTANQVINIIHAPEIDIDSGDAQKYLTSSVKMPLYALRLKDPNDITSIDLWSFKLKTQTFQRGGVSILNNVINPVNGEKTLIKVNNPKDGDVRVIVMTLDGSVISYLNRGNLSQGEHYFTWDGKTNNGKEVSRGLYFVRIVGNGLDETRKVMIVK